MEKIMKKILGFILFAGFAQIAFSNGIVEISSTQSQQVIAKFREIARLANGTGSTATATQCGYIFPGDASKFGCKGSGRAAGDVAAACAGGGELACTGSGSGRTCTCAFN